jgi:uncharacterized protein with PIN domain
MALFGLFGKKSDADIVRKHAERATNRRAQAVDRWEAIQALLRVGSPEAVEALMPRFAFYVDPSITDQEEKDAVFDGIVQVGSEAIAPVVGFLRRAESASWSIKILDRIATPEVVVEKLVALLSDMDTEYERDPQRKVQMLAALEERRDPCIARCVARFLADANETVRFHAAGAVLSQPEAAAHRDDMLRCLVAEDSVRVRNRILEGFATREWDVGANLDAVRAKLAGGYTLDARGIPRRPQ